MSAPRLLYVTPFVPLSHGRGSAMRAAANLEALSRLFSVTLALVNPDPAELDALDAKAQGLEKVLVLRGEYAADRLLSRLPGWRLKILVQMLWPTPFAVARARSALRACADSVDLTKFAVIHCFRLQCAPLIQFRDRTAGRPSFVLDLDDYESHARLRGLRHLSKKPFSAAATLVEGLKYRLLERRYIPLFDKALVCSGIDKAKLTRRFPHVPWTVAPNIVAAPAPEPRRAHTPFTFLFVGTLDYGPNKDAVLYFCREVLPLLRTAVAAPFKIRIVGRNPDSAILGLANGEDVDVVANPARIAPFYLEADVCIAPIRAGGGTRIKILEAFSYQLPVVATSIGAEGLDLEPSVNIEIGDTPTAFALACARLMADEKRRTRLSAAGYDVYQRRFSPLMLTALFQRLFADKNHAAHQ